MLYSRSLFINFIYSSVRLSLSSVWTLISSGSPQFCLWWYTILWRLWLFVVAVQSLSHVQLSVNSWTTAHKASLSFTISWSLLKSISIELVIPSNHLILCCSLLLLPSIFPSIRVFSKESDFCIRWPKYWSFRISPSNKYSELISFRIDWFDVLAAQRTLKSPLQHHNSKASILWYSAFFMVQSSHPYITTGKTIALTIWTFVGKVKSLLFNILSIFVITFLPRRKHLFISWLQSPSRVTWESKKIKSVTASTVTDYYLYLMFYPWEQPVCSCRVVIYNTIISN